MIKLNENIWIGDSTDEKSAQVDAVLNVAHDLRPTREWGNGIEYMHVGIIDGPGNPLTAYYSAVLALHTLRRRHHRVMVCCHDGGRSIAVAIMYMNSISRCGWDTCTSIMKERLDTDLPIPHVAHMFAFDRINWKSLDKLIRG